MPIRYDEPDSSAKTKNLLSAEAGAGVHVQALLEPSDLLMVDDQALDVKWADINATAAGATTVVEGDASDPGAKKIRVIAVLFTVSEPVSVGWLSNADVLIEPMSFAAHGGMNHESRRGYFVETSAAAALRIFLSDNATVRGRILYVEVDE